MLLITNKDQILADLIFREEKDKFREVKGAVAYCEDYTLFEYCRDHKIKLTQHLRLDQTNNLDLQKLKSFLKYKNINIHIIGGTHFHPKVIWCLNYGAYIGSANLTKSALGLARKNNTECGIWFTQKELKANKLIEPLQNFFKSVETKGTSLSKLSQQAVKTLTKGESETQFKSNNSKQLQKYLNIHKGEASLLSQAKYKMKSLKKTKTSEKQKRNSKYRKNQKEFFEKLESELKKSIPHARITNIRTRNLIWVYFKNGLKFISIYCPTLEIAQVFWTHGKDKHKINRAFYKFLKIKFHIKNGIGIEVNALKVMQKVVGIRIMDIGLIKKILYQI